MGVVLKRGDGNARGVESGAERYGVQALVTGEALPCPARALTTTCA